MSNISFLRKTALSFPESNEQAHFEKTSFRVQTKIFATYNEKEKWATLKFTPEEQLMFCRIDVEHIFPVPNAWGRLGWTHVRINKLSDEVVGELLKAAFIAVANKKLGKLLMQHESD